MWFKTNIKGKEDPVYSSTLSKYNLKIERWKMDQLYKRDNTPISYFDEGTKYVNKFFKTKDNIYFHVLSVCKSDIHDTPQLLIDKRDDCNVTVEIKNFLTSIDESGIMEIGEDEWILSKIN
tara:strand:- start:1669 stop:2031 length:363 start_codon:yes stop_codon:yes gene_type:complete